MNCIVTAGPAYEPLDDVRRLTNFSTGRLGTELANYLTSQGHDVTLILGESATWAGPRRAGRVLRFSTAGDLRDQLAARAGKKIDALFHAAAVSDFRFGRLFAPGLTGRPVPLKPSPKIPTRAGTLLVELLPTPKIIAELRSWFPQALIVGWKFEVVGARSRALLAARHQLTSCATNACVANGPAYGRGFGLVSLARHRHFAGQAGLFAAFNRLLQSREG